MNQSFPKPKLAGARKPHLPPCRACSPHPLSWPQSPPGGHWCQNHTFWLGPECWSAHWKASHLERDTMRERGKVANDEKHHEEPENATQVMWLSDYLCVSLTDCCVDALTPSQSAEWGEERVETSFINMRSDPFLIRLMSGLPERWIVHLMCVVFCEIYDRTYCYCYLPQDVLRDGFAFLNNLLIEFIQRCVHQLHTDPNIPLKTKQERLPHTFDVRQKPLFHNLLHLTGLRACVCVLNSSGGSNSLKLNRLARTRPWCLRVKPRDLFTSLKRAP